MAKLAEAREPHSIRIRNDVWDSFYGSCENRAYLNEEAETAFKLIVTLRNEYEEERIKHPIKMKFVGFEEFIDGRL